MMLNKIILFAFIILMIWVIVGFYLSHRLILMLKNNHYETWKDLGSPSLFANNSIKNNISMINFLRKKEYLILNDTKLSKKAFFYWTFGKIYLMYFLGLISLIIIYWYLY